MYSALNILGLAAGMAVALYWAMGILSNFEIVFCRYKNIYQACHCTTGNGEATCAKFVAYSLADVLKKDIPGIKYVARTDWIGSHGLVAGIKNYMIAGLMRSDFLKIFQYDLLKGNAADVLKDPIQLYLLSVIAKHYLEMKTR